MIRAALSLAFAASIALGESEEIIYDYDMHVAPLLERYCVDCHGPNKQKSKFRVDAFDRLMTPGSSDEMPVVPYAPMESPLMEYLLMPKSDEYAMPPEGEPTPTAEEIVLISQWIYHGATSSEIARAKLPLSDQLADSGWSAVENLRARGAIVHKVEAVTTGLFVDLRGIGSMLSPTNADHLMQLAPRIVEMNLSGMNAGALSATDWSQFGRLQRLNLSRAQIAADAIAGLSRLTELAHLNLYGTTLDEPNRLALTQLKTNRLYLGSTGLTGSQIDDLIKTLPDTQIYADIDHQGFHQITIEARNNSTTFRPDEPKPTAP